jgi:hypothetical protein
MFWEALGLERGPLSLVRTTKKLLGMKTETNDRVIRCADHTTPSIRKSWHFANKRRSLSRHSSLADESHGVFFMSHPVDRQVLLSWYINVPSWVSALPQNDY